MKQFLTTTSHMSSLDEKASFCRPVNKTTNSLLGD
jgi:hypothetical protein